MKAMNQPLVSVVITTKNEAANIENCLKSIQEQSYRNFEIIVVDNDSTDKTCEIARKYTEKVFIKGPERSVQRNYGMIEKAKGKYVIFLDADMLVSRYLIERAVGAMENSDDVALYITEVVLGKGYWGKVRRFERMFYNGTAIDGSRFFTRDVITKIHGFDEELYAGEDWDLDKRVRKVGKISFLENNYPDLKGNWYRQWPIGKFIKQRGVDPRAFPVAIFHNESDFKLRKYLKKKAYYSGNIDEYVSKWDKDDPDIKKQLGFGYRFFTVFTEDGKWKKVATSPLLFFGVYLLKFLIGVTYFQKKLFSKPVN